MAHFCHSKNGSKNTSRSSSPISDGSTTKLARHLSIPANFKLQLEARQRVAIRKADTICGKSDSMKIKNPTISKDDCDATVITTSERQQRRLESDMERRHSDRQFSSKLAILQQSPSPVASADLHTTVKPVSSVSSSLRASDSAFSQSQSTLGSGDEADRRSSSSFTRSINELTKDHRSSSSNIILINDTDNNNNISEGSSGGSSNTSGRLLISKESKQLNPFDDSASGKEEPCPDGFRMIWRNLRFCVPEKRFSQFNRILARYKETIWSTKDDHGLDQARNRSYTSNPTDLPHTNINDPNQHLASRCNSSSDSTISNETTSTNIAFTGVPRKVIFDNLNGCAESGKLTAILGPSGAGKTTLLNCLTVGLIKGVSGSILINDYQIKETKRRRLKLCIIPQKDYLFDKLTVMENLLFASRLKNTQPNFEHHTNVQRVTNLLGLQSCLQLKTGKLSGGQYKRVSIAQELLSKPDILILDEPTSGLDSLTCYRTVSVLCDLVNMSRAGLIKPLAIIMTIHQPQMKVFNLFHHVYIMSSLGDCVYEGKPEDLIDTVADCCKLLPPPDDLNPASFIIDLASQVYGPEPMDKLVSLQRENFSAYYGMSDDVGPSSGNDNNSATTMGDILTNKNDSYDVHVTGGDRKANNLHDCQLAIFMGDKRSQLEAKLPNNKQCDITNDQTIIRPDTNNRHDRLNVSECLKRCNNHDRCFWLHTWLLVNRLWVAMWRDPLLATTRITFHLLIPFVFYFIYSQKSGEANACPLVERELDIQTMTSEENLHRLQEQHNELILTFENVSLFFLLLYSFSMCVLAITALSFPLNMQILLKETSNGWYSMSRFVMAKTIADLPMELMMPIISVSIAYFLTGQPSSYLSWRMLTITAVMTLCSLISQTQGLLFGAYFMNNVQAAVFISQASSLPWIMLSGFTTRVIELPAVLRWLSFGSIYRLGIESIVAARYGFGMCPCDKELVDDKPTRLIGISDQLRSVMRYYFEMYAEHPNDSATQSQSTNNKTSNSSSSDDILERLASTISRANTYGAEIVTCHDVRPFIMSARGVDESTLPRFILILIIIFAALKILLFFVVRLRAGR